MTLFKLYWCLEYYDTCLLSCPETVQTECSIFTRIERGESQQFRQSKLDFRKLPTYMRKFCLTYGRVLLGRTT